MASPFRIVSTKLIPEAVKLRYENENIVINDLPFLTIDYVDNDQIHLDSLALDRSIIFTSQHGVIGMKSQSSEAVLLGKRCYCINGVTKETAIRHGIEVIDSAPNATRLAEQIIKRGDQNLYHMTTSNRREELYKILDEHQIKVTPFIVYQKKINHHRVENFDAVSFFSPSQIDAFFNSGNELDPYLPAYCIGSTTGNHLASYSHKNILVASEPTLDSVFQLITTQNKV